MLAEGYNRLTGSEPNRLEKALFPTPMLGVNTFLSMADLSPREAIYLYNIMPEFGGLKTRPGHKELSSLPDSINAKPVTTIIPFLEHDNAGASDRIFGVTEDGIYEMQKGYEKAFKVFSFTTKAGAGYGPFITWANANGDQYIFYADSSNGLILFEAKTNKWSVPINIKGITHSLVRFVTVHKLRIWLVTKDSSQAFYLPPNSVAGNAKSFSFGSRFRQGGSVHAICNLSLDAGDGIDDYLAAISSTGDMLLYQGSDPSLSSWAIKGRWQLGSIPNSRQIAAEFLGDIVVLSKEGLISVKDLVAGGVNRIKPENPLSKMNGAIKRVMQTELQDAGWQLLYAARQNLLIVKAPENSSRPERHLQFVYNVNTQAWSFWQDVPAQCMASGRQALLFGANKGALWEVSGNKDGVTLSDPDNSGQSIRFSGLTAYSHFDLPGISKRIAFIKPVFSANQDVNYHFQPLYDFDIAPEDLRFATDIVHDGGRSQWDTGKWDDAVWDGFRIIRGRVSGAANSFGEHVALAFAGRSDDTSVLESVNVSFEKWLSI